MNTPAHAMLNLWLLGRPGGERLVWPIVVGAVLPDLAMMAFYAFQRLLAGRSEQEIWGSLYHDPAWQTFFDLFNSLPLLAVLALVAWRLEAPRALALLASMIVHGLCDLPVHREDAHRHFFPLTDWRFESPVSYWDPAHHGAAFTLFEIALTALLTGLLWRRFPRLPQRRLIAAIAVLYALYFGFVAMVWL